MVNVHRRFELYVALRKTLTHEVASYLVEHLTEVERDPELQRHNRARFEANAPAIYNLYAEMRSRIGEAHTKTLFEMLDPLEWGDGADAGEHGQVAATAAGSEHGDR
jgi:hypothetical protein